MYLRQGYEEKEKYTAEVIEWMHHCYDLWTTGRIGELRPNPFYARKDLLTPAIVESIVATLEFLMKEELSKFPDYHRAAQGMEKEDPRTLVTVGWNKMPYQAQLALVEGIDQILQPYRTEVPPYTHFVPPGYEYDWE